VEQVTNYVILSDTLSQFKNNAMYTVISVNLYAILNFEFCTVPNIIIIIMLNKLADNFLP